MNKAKYDNYYIAFLDLLGFKEIVKNKECSEILGILKEVKKRYNFENVTDENNPFPLVPDDKINYRIMSDSICIYIRDDIKYALPVLIILCTHFQERMLKFDTPILVRGAIFRGELYAENEIFFGKGLSETYLLEENIAQFPRIIIPMNIIDDFSGTPDEKNWFNSYLVQDFDAFYVTKYIEHFCTSKANETAVKKLNDYIKYMLSTKYEKSIREKYLYLRSIFNNFYREE